MAIYRGPGGSGDATQDAASEVLLALAAKDAAIAAQVAAEAAQAAAQTAETNAELAETNAETAETNAANSATLAASYTPSQTGNAGKFLTTNGTVTSWGTVSSAGTVTSVAATVPSFLSVSGSPITSSGTLAFTYSGTALPVANGGTGSTTSTGSGAVVLETSPTLVTPALGTPASGVVTNLTGTASININGTVGATTASTGAFTTVSASGVATFSAGSVSAPAITTTGDTNTGIFFPAADTIAFAEGGAEAMRITSSGVVCVNRTSDLGTVKFVVESDTTTVNPMTVSNTRSTASTDYHIIMYRAGNIVGSVQTTLSATSFVTSSDYRLKENIAPMTGALSKVAQLNPVTYDWKAGGSSQGFIAHELQAVVPDCVVGDKDEVDAEGNIKPQGVDTSFLVATLTAAIQELNAKVDAQAVRIAELEGAR